MIMPPVLLLHGWGLSGNRFSAVGRLLRAYGYAVYAPDFPGFKSDTADDVSRTLNDYVVFLADFITKNKIKSPVIVGHSFGGRVALKYVEMHPNSVRVLILTGTPGYRSQNSLKRNFFMVVAKMGKPFFLLPGLRLVKERVASLMYTAAGARDYSRAQIGLRQTFKNIVEASLESAMAAVHIPTMLLWGELDNLVPVSIAKKMQRAIAESTLRVIPMAKHSLPYDDPDMFAKLVHEFIQNRG